MLITNIINSIYNLWNYFLNCFQYIFYFNKQKNQLVNNQIEEKEDEYIVLDKLNNYIIFHNDKWYSKQKYLPFLYNQNQQINLDSSIYSDFSIILKWIQIKFNILLTEQNFSKRNLLDNIIEFRNTKQFTIWQINIFDKLLLQYQQKYNYKYKLSREINLYYKNTYKNKNHIIKLINNIDDINLFSKYIFHNKASIYFIN
jgi:hypothetical protein